MGAKTGTLTTRLLAEEYSLPLTITVNNACNLACDHCYLGAGSIDQKVEVMDETFALNLINQINALNSSHVAIVGMEPYLNTESIALTNLFVSKLNAITSVISNGTTLLRFKDNIVFPDYLDVSVDFGSKLYGKIRKNLSGAPGNYENVMEGILASLDNTQVSTLHVLSKETQGYILDSMETVEALSFHNNYLMGLFSPMIETERGKDYLVSSPDSIQLIQSIPLHDKVRLHLSDELDNVASLIALSKQQGISISYITKSLTQSMYRITYDGKLYTLDDAIHIARYGEVGVDLRENSLFDSIGILKKRAWEDNRSEN